MTTRVLYLKGDIDRLAAYLKGRKLPVTVTIQDGRHRTVEQNKLQRLWCKEIAEQLGDRTAEEVRGECKLTFGVPILRAENEAFRAAYDKHVKPLPYETKVAMMQEPLDWPVTRLMTVRQKTAYLEAVLRHYTEAGLELSVPDERHRIETT